MILRTSLTKIVVNSQQMVNLKGLFGPGGNLINICNFEAEKGESVVDQIGFSANNSDEKFIECDKNKPVNELAASNESLTTHFDCIERVQIDGSSEFLDMIDTVEFLPKQRNTAENSATIQLTDYYIVKMTNLSMFQNTTMDVLSVFLRTMLLSKNRFTLLINHRNWPQIVTSNHIKRILLAEF